MMEPYCAELLGKLCIYERDYLRYTKCLCRGTEVLVSNRPEELVRQVLLLFLLHESGLTPSLIDVKVEYSNLDVAIYKHARHECFQPMLPPMVIVEVKREDATLLDHESQLLRYLRENQTGIGVLFNANENIVYEKGRESTPIHCPSRPLDKLREVIIGRLAHQEGDDASIFEQAQVGNVDSFIYLARKYGKHTLHKFTFTLKSSPTVIVGCCFRVEEQNVYYDNYGKYVPKKKFVFRREDFDKLIALIY